MAGDMAGKSPSTPPKNEWVSLLKQLETCQIAEVFDGVCSDCQSLLRSRLLKLINEKPVHDESGKVGIPSISSSGTSEVSTPVNSNRQLSNHERTPTSKESSNSMTRDRISDNTSPSTLVNGKPRMRDLFSPELPTSDRKHSPSSAVANGVPEGEEWGKFLQVKRKKNFVHYERVNGKEINVLQGLELHTGVFSAEDQKKIVESVYNFQRMGRKGQLMERTYTEPLKWMRGKGRVTMQFGCCYNYAVDKDGNPPGIIRDEEVDQLPPVFKQMISKMVRWHVLPPTCVPNSCIVNIYDEGDCIPPHIDHHDFLRPFCTVSFLAECNILFGSNLKISGPGEFTGPVAIPLPVGSVLVLNGNGADVAKHCVPAVPAKRISVTFRRMDDSKMPYKFSPDPELLNLRPLHRPSVPKAGVAAHSPHHETKADGKMHKPSARETADRSFMLQNDDFPTLGNGIRSRAR